MKKYFLFIFYFILGTSNFAFCTDNLSDRDTSEVKKINKLGFTMRLTDPNETIEDAKKALSIAKSINYLKGVGESYRIMGIGYFYLDKHKIAIDNYLSALDYFQQINDLNSQAKVYNNIGNLYNVVDYDQALEFFQKALKIATKVSDKNLIASLNMNIGTVYYHKKSFYQALNYYNRSNDLFTQLNDSANLVQSMQNIGVANYALYRYDNAEKLLKGAIAKAKQLDLNRTVASIDLTLADIYTNQNKYDNAEKSIKEGIIFAAIVRSEVILANFKYSSYILDVKRKNYEKALADLYSIYHQDSVSHEHSNSAQIDLIREQAKNQARKRENEILIQQKEYDRVKFLSVILVTALLFVCTGLLINNVRRKAKTNEQLTSLNAEVSRQKDNLDRINHHLEEIIDERTKDLQVKNKKLSEYSSYLSHQIRGPISTLKGLMNLEKEGLVDQQECINMMNKCVSEIDDKIMEISDMLHDSRKARL